MLVCLGFCICEGLLAVEEAVDRVGEDLVEDVGVEVRWAGLRPTGGGPLNFLELVETTLFVRGGGGGGVVDVKVGRPLILVLENSLDSEDRKAVDGSCWDGIFRLPFADVEVADLSFVDRGAVVNVWELALDGGGRGTVTQSGSSVGVYGFDDR